MSACGQDSETAPRGCTLRARPDLVMRPLWFGGQRYWGVKDPVSLRYFQLREEEHFILEQLRRPTSVAEIRTRFERRFAPRKLDSRHLQGFLGLLFRQGLVMSDAPGQGDQLLSRGQRQFRSSLAAGLTNLLAIRLPGIDPTRFLRWLDGRGGWVFSRWCVALCGALIAAAGLLAVVQFDALRAKLPTFGAFFSPQNILLLAVVLGLTKIIHELAHGLTCRHFGGECRELGVMLLAFTPCLYCDVTDAWLLPNKWRRVAVGVAGIYVELVLAAVATFAWWFTEPGLVNSILLNVMVVCSLSTLLINGNPLLRFDGYFVLSDLLEVPNLQPRAAAVALSGIQRWLRGRAPDGGPIVRERHPGWLALYALASIAYRLAVVAIVLLCLHRVLRGYELELLAELATVVVVAGMVGRPTWKAVRWFQDPAERRATRSARVATRLGLVILVVAAALLTPLPSRILAPVMLEPADAERVYVTIPGTILTAVEPGQSVRAGEVLARLENRDLDREIAQLTGEIELQRVRLTNLRGARVADASVERQIPVVEESLRDLEQRLRQRRTDRSRLTLRAARDGVALPPPPRENGTDKNALPRWSGTPLDMRNRGALLETGTLLCLIGDPQRLQGLLVLDQAAVEFVQPGQRVRVLLAEWPRDILEGRIREVAELRLDTAPRELLASGLVPIQSDVRGERPTHTSYLARVAFASLPVPALMATAGRARIHTAPRSLAARLHRYWKNTVRFDL